MPYLRCYDKFGKHVKINNNSGPVSFPNAVVSIEIENGGWRVSRPFAYETLSRLISQ